MYSMALMLTILKTTFAPQCNSDGNGDGVKFNPFIII